MEVKRLYPFILMLVLVGMLLGVGILTMDKFGQAARTSTTVTGESVTLTAYAGTAANNNITSVTFFGNATVNTTTFGTDVNVTAEGAISTNTSFENGTYSLSYVYDATSVATASVTSTASAMNGVSSSWLPLVVTVVVLAMILAIVIGSFSGRRP